MPPTRRAAARVVANTHTHGRTRRASEDAPEADAEQASQPSELSNTPADPAVERRHTRARTRSQSDLDAHTDTHAHTRTRAKPATSLPAPAEDAEDSDSDASSDSADPATARKAMPVASSTRAAPLDAAAAQRAALALVSRITRTQVHTAVAKAALPGGPVTGIDVREPVLMQAVTALAESKLYPTSSAPAPEGGALIRMDPAAFKGNKRGKARNARVEEEAAPAGDAVHAHARAVPSAVAALAESVASKSVVMSGGVAETASTAPRVFTAPHKRTSLEKREDIGSKWFNMKAQPLTAEMRKDLLILRNRAYIDPKRHYKTREEREGPMPRFFHVGTVQEGAHEVLSQRLTKKQRAPTLVDALLADEQFRQYAKKHAIAAQTRGRSGNAAGMKRAREDAAPTWKRRMMDTEMGLRKKKR